MQCDSARDALADDYFCGRWDQHGFRFYYDTRSTPDGTNYQTFDKGTEIDWSVKNQTGLQTWDPVYEYDVTQGITSKNDISWATDAAREKHIPLGINLSTNNQVWLENWFPEDMAQHMPQFLGAYYNGPMVTEDGMRFLSWDSIVSAADHPGAAIRSYGLSFYKVALFFLTPGRWYGIASDKTDFVENLLGPGWSAPETDFVWSEAGETSLILPYLSPPSVTLDLDLGA